MFPTTETEMGQPQGNTNPSVGGLEDRLRGLILNNSMPIDSASATNANMSLSPTVLPPTPTLPPHMMMATPAEKQKYLANIVARAAVQDQQATPNAVESQQGGRKRMNQSQRRQMNSQLSIPIDARPHQNHGPPSHGFTPYSAQPQSAWSPSPTYFNNSPQFHNLRFQQQQQPYSPRFPQPSPASPYPQQMNYQNSPRSGVYPNQPSPGYYSLQSPATTSLSPPWQNYNQPSPVPNTFSPRPNPQNRQLYQPGSSHGQGRARSYGPSSEELAHQNAYLDDMARKCVPQVEIDSDEANEKEAFRVIVEKACKEAILEYEQQEIGNHSFDPSSVELKCYGSLSSGFATKGSDMDLKLITPFSNPPAESPESSIPRLLEKKLLDLGYGARLLTRTRVPIIKLCQQPSEKLMADLLEERTKWENGFIDDQEDNIDEKAVAGHGNPTGSPSPEPTNPSPQLPNAKVAQKEEPSHEHSSSQPSGKSQFTLQQRENQSLNDYFNRAKRMLRSRGGRDLSINSAELSLVENKILSDICRAFILGLSSKELSSRLRAYGSIAPLFDPSVPFVQRSLNGIYNQIEGEKLAMGWDERSLEEATEKHELECRAHVEAWKVLLDKAGALTETEMYSRQLHNALERLKKISSLQFLSLEQMQYETPQQYFARFQRLKDDLEKRKDRLRSADEGTENIFVARYITGIHNPEIRDELQSLKGIPLKEVAHRHQIMHLAKDYEHGLETHLYDEADQAHVEQYIKVLRDIAKGLPSDPAHTQLVTIMRTLPDPTQTSLSKPRDRYKDHLEFPKNAVGIQCDINFSNHLALHNTLLLRLYSVSDARVKPMVLFVKHWAKTRGINTPYRGTLGSYGYVLMVLHYLVHVVHPPVCPNLQHTNREPPAHLSPEERKAQTSCDGCDVRFWRDEEKIRSLALQTRNNDSLGLLLRGFFEYFAQSGQMTTVKGDTGFDWGREVLSLRTKSRGILWKKEKGWVGARTVFETAQIAAPPPTPSTPAFKTPATPATPGLESAEKENDLPASAADTNNTPATSRQPTKTVEEIKEIRHRYLFAIEDPFELDHNVARTVTHNGIVAIRDEFRRAWGIIKSVGTKFDGKNDLLEPMPGPGESKAEVLRIMDEIHGLEGVGVGKGMD